jgi:RHS repeat-associated protein
MYGVSCVSTSFCVSVDNAANALVYSQASLASEQLTWDTSGSLPLVLSDGTNYYVYGPTGEPVEQVNVTASPPTNNPIFLTYTQPDSSWLATNTTGDELSYWRYDAYGNLALGTPDSPFGYAGQYTDTSSDPSGFDNMRARWYQSQTGAFTTVDPAFDQTDQAYGYAGDDPINTSDPSGLWPCSWPPNEGPPASAGGPCGASTIPNLSGGTEGYCFSVNSSVAIVDGEAAVCLVRTDNEQQVGVTLTVGGGFGLTVNKSAIMSLLGKVQGNPITLVDWIKGLAEINGDVTWQTSNATNLCQLAKGFEYTAVGGAFLLAGSWSRFHSASSGISGTDWSIGLGYGADIATGKSYTWVRMFAPASSAASLGNVEIDVLDLGNPFSWFYDL